MHSSDKIINEKEQTTPEKKKAIKGGKECVHVCINIHISIHLYLSQRVCACACISVTEISTERLPEETGEYDAKVDICT